MTQKDKKSKKATWGVKNFNEAVGMVINCSLCGCTAQHKAQHEKHLNPSICPCCGASMTNTDKPPIGYQRALNNPS